MAWYDFLIGKPAAVVPPEPIPVLVEELAPTPAPEPLPLFPDPKQFPRDRYDGYWEIYEAGPNHSFVRVMRRSGEEVLGEQMLRNVDVRTFIEGHMNRVVKGVQ